MITADHTSMSANPIFQTDVGIYQIPLVLINASVDKTKFNTSRVVQQIDIMPSVLDELGYDLPYFSFGHSWHDTVAVNSGAISFKGQSYQLINDSICLQFDGRQTIATYRYKQDKLCSMNLSNKIKRDFTEEKYLKAFIQQYNAALVNNKMVLTK